MRSTTKVGFSILGLLIILILSEVYYRLNLQWIPAGYVGVKYSSGSGVDRSKVYSPQAIFTAPWQQVYRYPTKVMNAVYSQDPSAGEVKSADGIQITTKDTANTIFDVSVFYRIEPKNVFTVLDTFGVLPIDQIQSLHIRRAVREEANAVGNEYDVYSLMENGRIAASEKLTKRLQDKLGKKGITILHAFILTAYPSDSLVKKIHNNVNSVTAIQIAELEQQIAGKQNQINVVNASAQQKAQSIAGSGTGTKSLAIIDLEIAQKAAEKWSGHLPTVAGGGNKTVVVNTTGEKVTPTQSTPQQSSNDGGQ